MEFASSQVASKPVEERYKVTDFSLHDGLIDPGAFYDAGYDETLAALIAHVLAMEAPIAETLLVQRIARAHGFQRTGRVIRDRVMQLARQRHHAAEDGINETFIWTDVAAMGLWRGFRLPATPDDIRQIEEIAAHELAMAARSSQAEDVAVDIARQFGIRRLSSSARRRIEAVLQAAAEENPDESIATEKQAPCTLG
jgi:hypothetical protein